ncbi:MAG: erythronate-4-phosphate dehydrogenase [Kiritimatiellia bacterium]|jgi:erythronate-4-phosphate dehydrogenase
MRIVCANSLTFGKEAFATMGGVTWLPESEIDRAAVADADAVIVRSKTQLNRALLEGSRVRFAATATAGTDHVDEAWLADAGIAFYAAAGCNAPAVGQYVTAALLHLAEKYEFDLTGKTLGIVGHGNAGKQVERKALALGMQVLLNDPPLFDQTGDARYIHLKELVPACDVLTLHVPLIDDGPHPTRSMVSEEYLRLLKPGSFLINACRGEVIPSHAIINTLREGIIQGAVLDVWESEPRVPAALLELVDIGTSHIAGHSFEGKFNGTQMCYEAACAFFGVTPSFDGSPLTPVVCETPVRITPGPSALIEAVRASYDLLEDDHLLRESMTGDEAERVKRFKSLRNTYRLRREFPAWTLELNESDPSLSDTLTALGFHLV